MTTLIVQYGGWPRQCAAWVAEEAGAHPPPRDWRGTDHREAVGGALRALGMDRAEVVQVPDAGDPDGPERNWGTVLLEDCGPASATAE